MLVKSEMEENMYFAFYTLITNVSKYISGLIY